MNSTAAPMTKCRAWRVRCERSYQARPETATATARDFLLTVVFS